MFISHCFWNTIIIFVHILKQFSLFKLIYNNHIFKRFSCNQNHKISICNEQYNCDVHGDQQGDTFSVGGSSRRCQFPTRIQFGEHRTSSRIISFIIAMAGVIKLGIAFGSCLPFGPCGPFPRLKRCEATWSESSLSSALSLSSTETLSFC